MSEKDKDKEENNPGDFILDDVDNAPADAKENETPQQSGGEGKFSVDEAFLIRILAQQEDIKIPFLRKLVNSSAWFQNLILNLGLGVFLWVYNKLPNTTPDKISEYFNNPDALVNDVVSFFNDLYTAKQKAQEVEELRNQLKECETFSNLALSKIHELSERYAEVVQRYMTDSTLFKLLLGSKVLSGNPEELEKQVSETIIKTLLGVATGSGND